MWKLLKKKSLSNSIPEEYLYLYIEDRFYSILKNQKYSSYQEDVDDYFYRKWKEISYFFLFDNKKQSILDDEIKKESEDDRKFELKLLSIWCAYNLNDVRMYSEVLNKETVYENKTISYSKERLQIYKKIVFNKEKWTITYNEFWNIKTILKEEDCLKVFNDTKNEIISNGLEKFYKIDNEKLIISVIKGSKLELYEKMLNLQKSKLLFRREPYWKEINTEISIEDKKFIVYLSVNGSVINSNLKYRNTNNKEIKIKLYKEENKYIENNKIDFITFKRKNNYLVSSNKENITNYLKFENNILNNSQISDLDKQFLKKIFIRSLPIKWVTISWLKDIWSNTIPPFFNIASKTFREKIKNGILTKDLNELMIFNNDSIITKVDLSKLEKLINDSIENEVFPTIKGRIRDRLYSNCEIVNENII